MSDLAPPALPRYSCKSINPNITVVYTQDIDEANHQVSKLTKGPVGFDLEWKPTYVKGQPENPVALVQLANHDTVLLFQVSAMRAFPEKLQDFLESSDSVKTGVGIQNDVKKLYTDHKVSTRNVVDLSLLARSVDNARWKGKYTQPIGLARLVEMYEEHSLQKGRITRSNWESRLSDMQQDYAANDAHAGLIIYERLMAMRESMVVVPKAVYYTFDAVRGRLCEPSGAQWSAYNPNYDPGPPPPPRFPKASNVTLVDGSTATAMAQTGFISMPALAASPSDSDRNTNSYFSQESSRANEVDPQPATTYGHANDSPTTTTGFPARRPHPSSRSRIPPSEESAARSPQRLPIQLGTVYKSHASSPYQRKPSNPQGETTGSSQGGSGTGRSRPRRAYRNPPQENTPSPL